MGNLKKGDIVKLKTDINMSFPKGISMTVFYANNDYVELCTSFKAKSYNVKKIGELKMQYEESNRYKLAQTIKGTGITSKDLSLSHTNGKSIYYFSNFTKKSRFEDRGDISEDLLIGLRLSVAFAEENILGQSFKHKTKTVLDHCKDFVETTKTSVDKLETWANDLNENHGKSNIVVTTNCETNSFAKAVAQVLELENHAKEEPKSNKSLFISASFIIFILAILFILNNYLQVV